MRGYNCRQVGFTLIELLVTVSIIVLVTGGSLAAYSTFSENRQLEADARNLNTFLNKVRSRSVYLEYPSGCTGLLSFEINTSLNTEGERTILSYHANCSNGDSETLNEEVLDSSVMTADVSLVFLPATGKLEADDDVVITLQSIKGASRTRSVVVNQFLGTNNIINDEQ